MARSVRGHQGKYFPRNPKKYVGNPANITYRSGWELRFMQFCDLNENVIQWGSEEIQIPYVKPTDRRIHNYIPDFIMKYKDKTGAIRIDMVEIKPLKETVMSKKSTTADHLSIVINEAKWGAAQAFCAARGMSFRVLTERDLFSKGKPK